MGAMCESQKVNLVSELCDTLTPNRRRQPIVCGVISKVLLSRTQELRQPRQSPLLSTLPVSDRTAVLFCDIMGASDENTEIWGMNPWKWVKAYIGAIEIPLTNKAM